MMLVVSDASPLTALMQIGRAELLSALFGTVLIPPAVEVELTRFHAELPGFITVMAVHNQNSVDILEAALDPGEAEAIVLAEESQADYLLMDEKLGRRAAEERGLKVVGLLGVLLIAKKAGHVPSVAPLMDELQTKAGFFVSDAVKHMILQAAGE
jgi:predicted nucleic acid-binding protein